MSEELRKKFPITWAAFERYNTLCRAGSVRVSGGEMFHVALGELCRTMRDLEGERTAAIRGMALEMAKVLIAEKAVAKLRAEVERLVKERDTAQERVPAPDAVDADEGKGLARDRLTEAFRDCADCIHNPAIDVSGCRKCLGDPARPEWVRARDAAKKGVGE